MLKRLLNIWILIAFVAAVSLAGCSDELSDAGLTDTPESTGTVFLRFRLSLAGSGIPDGSRAGVEQDRTPGTSREDVISSIDLLAFDAETGKLVDRVVLTGNHLAGIYAGRDAVIAVSAKENQRLHIYAAANLPKEICERFVVGVTDDKTVVSYAREDYDYWDVIDKFIAGCAGKQESLQNSAKGCIPMTGQVELSDGSGSTITVDNSHKNENTALAVKVTVSRIVAKMHVLATLETQDGDYVSAMSQTGDAGGATKMGWIHLGDVRYMPNGTNKSTYLFQQSTGSQVYPLWCDDNMGLGGYVNQGGVALEFDESLWRKDFAFYDGMSLHNDNSSSVSHFAKAEAFSQRRLELTQYENTSDERYVKGMYCLENYFDIPANSDEFAVVKDAIPMVTHVSVAAKLTPKWIVIREDYMERMDDFVKYYKDDPIGFRNKYGLGADDFTQTDVDRWHEIRDRYNAYFTKIDYAFRGFRIVETVSEQDSQYILNWSLKHNGMWSNDPADLVKGKYPDGTFYSYDSSYDDHDVPDKPWQRYFYLSMGAVRAASGSDGKFATYAVQHIGGWGYYFTYLDHTGETRDGKTPYTASQVTRNTYYIVNISNFGSPGGTVTKPEHIKVNTFPVGWDYAGKGDINLH